MAGISPIDCKHPERLFVQSLRASPDAEREHVSVCRDCGQFLVTASRGGVNFRVAFDLPTDELVEAAGRYARYLADQQARKHRTICPDCGEVEAIVEGYKAGRPVCGRCPGCEVTLYFG